MNAAQLSTFKAAILSDANLAAARTAGDMGAMVSYYNAAGTGLVWRPSISVGELNTAIVWGEFIALTQGQRDAYSAVIQGPIDATNANVRAGFGSIFGGQSLTNLTALAQRVPTRFEQLFAVSQVTPVFGQSVSVADVAVALGS